MKFGGNTKYTLHPEYVHEYEIMSNSNIYIYIDSPLTNDDSDDEVLETLSNLLPAFG